jgi:AbrB family looped-hinge helix DNA binding protein
VPGSQSCGQVTIPAEMRKALGLDRGSRVHFSRHGRKVVLERVEEPAVDSLFGIYKPRKGHEIKDIDAAVETSRQRRVGR